MNEHYLVAYHGTGNNIYQTSLIEPNGRNLTTRIGIEGLDSLADTVAELMNQVSLDHAVAHINMVPQNETGSRLSNFDNKRLCSLIAKKL